MEGMGLEDELSEMYRWAITVGFGSIRPWTSDFFNRFPQIPKYPDWSVAEKSIFTNLLFYRANYIAMVILAFTVAMYEHEKAARAGHFHNIMCRFWNPLLLFGLILCVVVSLVILKLPVRALPPPVQRYAMHVRSVQQRLGAAALVSLLLLALMGCVTALIWVMLGTLVCTCSQRAWALVTTRSHQPVLAVVLAHAALRPVKRTAEMHEMLARLNVKWSSPDGVAGQPTSDIEGGSAQRDSGAEAHTGDVRQRSASGSGHNMVPSGTPVALKGKVGSGAVQGGVPVNAASLPRPGGKHADGVHRRAGAAMKSD